MTALDQTNDLFEHAPCGLLSTTSSGTVVTVNDTFLAMAEADRAEVVGRYLIERLTRGSALYYETRFMPQLVAEGRASEVALELVLPGSRTLSVFVNAVTSSSPAGAMVIRFAVFDATVRRHYERELLGARRLAELSEKRVRSLQAATTALGAAEKEDDLGRALAEAACAATDAARVGVQVLGDDGVLGAPIVAGSLPGSDGASLVEVLFAAPGGGTELPAATVRCSDPTELELRFGPAAEGLRAERIEALVAVPIIDGTQTVGVVLAVFRRARAVEALTVELLESIAAQSVLVRQRIRLSDQLTLQSLHDALTGLPNRLSLWRRLDELLAFGLPDGHSIALVFIDLDGFKAVNDRLGHLGGDRALQQVGRELSRVVRSEDMVGRLGGDEFLLICENVGVDALQEIAERLRAAVRLDFGDEARELTLSASVGVSIYRADPGRRDVTGEALIHIADEAMYESKRAGKDRSTFVHV